MEYDDVLYYRLFWKSRRAIAFHYRKDPVPHVSNKKYRFFGWYKNPKMYKRERSLYNEYSEYIRSKRSPMNLPDPWNDDIRGDVRNRRSWKSKKIKKQYFKHL